MSKFKIMQKLTKETAARIMASRTLISSPGKYHVRVVNDVQALAEKAVVHKELAGGVMQISIANFHAYTPYHLKTFRALLKEGRFDDAANNSLSTSIRENDYIPAKNEIVELNVDHITLKSGEKALMVVGYNRLPVSSGGKISLEALMSEEELEVDGRTELETAEEILAKSGSTTEFANA